MALETARSNSAVAVMSQVVLVRVASLAEGLSERFTVHNDDKQSCEDELTALVFSPDGRLGRR